MGNEETRLLKELILKEERLLENSIRNDADKIAELIHADCVEFSASGKQNKYRPGESFGNIDGILYIDSNSVRMVDLADDCRLLLYVGTKVTENTRLKSNRSSIWKKSDGDWKMIFHQGTNSTE
ncbi:MAG: DUF4440 domain-containing protein [Spirochaetae bacterium HGW-Spirochaetae-3]|nr:MAG: DUF4440 domain-containing protein [Spirochaetae bacterium HGW-Spirochaetae-3]